MPTKVLAQARCKLSVKTKERSGEAVTETGEKPLLMLTSATTSSGKRKTRDRDEDRAGGEMRGDVAMSACMLRV